MSTITKSRRGRPLGKDPVRTFTEGEKKILIKKALSKAYLRRLAEQWTLL